MVMGPAAGSRAEFEPAPPIQPEEEVAAIETPVAEEPVAIDEDEMPEREPYVAPAAAEVRRPAPRAASASDPLEPFMALSAEEKIALFT
jgi:hypothetical protein